MLQYDSDSTYKDVCIAFCHMAFVALHSNAPDMEGVIGVAGMSEKEEEQRKGVKVGPRHGAVQLNWIVSLLVKSVPQLQQEQSGRPTTVLPNNKEEEHNGLPKSGLCQRSEQPRDT